MKKGKVYVAAREHKLLCLKCAKKHGIDMSDAGADRVTDRQILRVGGPVRCHECKAPIASAKTA